MSGRHANRTTAYYRTHTHTHIQTAACAHTARIFEGTFAQTHTNTYIQHIDTHMYKKNHIRLFLYLFLYFRTSGYSIIDRILLLKYIHIHIHIHIHTHICKHTYTYIHTHILIHIKSIDYL